MKLSHLTLSLLTLSAAPVFGATTLFNDNFTAGTNPGWSAGNTSLAAFDNVSFSVDSLDNGGLNGNTLLITNSANNRTALRGFSTTALAIGDSINLTLSYRFDTTPPDVSQFFGVGLGSAANGQGYYAIYNPGAATSTNSRVKIIPGGGAVTGGGWNNVGAGTTAHTTSFTITRTGADTLDILTDLGTSPATTVTRSVSSGSFTSYDTAFILIGSGTTSFYLDDAVVTYTPIAVPEPGSVALLAGIGGIGFVAFRRKRNG